MVHSSVGYGPPTAVTIWAHYGPYHVARVAALEDRGYQVIGFSYSPGSQGFPYFNHRTIRHERVNDGEVRSLTSFRNTLALLRKYHPRLVLACGYERPETAAALAYARLHRREQRPVVLVMGANQMDDQPRYRFREFVKRRYLRWFDGFLVGGSTHRAYLEVLGLADRPIESGYDCVDNHRIAAAARDARARGPRLAGADDYFLCVSRMVDVKNLPFLISAYRRYRDSLPEGNRPWKLVLCGDGPARREIEEAVARDRLSGEVVLAGVVTDPAEMANYYAFANAAILPSTTEPWGLVVNEAMAASLPVLVSKRCGSARHLVDEGENGFTFDPTDEPGLAALMLWMHNNRDRLPTMGERSADLVQNFSPERFAESVVSLEAEALRGRRQRGHA